MSDRDDRNRETAFEAFYARTAPSLWGYVSRVCGNATLAEDIVQEAFIRYLNSVREEMPEKQRKAFVYKIASRLVTDSFRRNKTLSLQRLEVNMEAEETAAAGDALSPDLRRLFAALSARDRALLWLAYAEGYDHAEIADIVGLKKTSVKVVLFRLRRSFAASLRSVGYHPEVLS